MCLTVTPKEATTVTWAIMTILVNCTRQIMTCEHIDIIYFTLGTDNYEFKSYKRSFRIFGKTFGAALNRM